MCHTKPCCMPVPLLLLLLLLLMMMVIMMMAYLVLVCIYTTAYLGTGAAVLGQLGQLCVRAQEGRTPTGAGVDPKAGQSGISQDSGRSHGGPRRTGVAPTLILRLLAFAVAPSYPSASPSPSPAIVDAARPYRLSMSMLFSFSHRRAHSLPHRTNVLTEACTGPCRESTSKTIRN
jgi:hypothetical protein